MIYLVFVNHGIQFKRIEENKLEEFIIFLRKSIIDKNIDVIAEEMSQWALEKEKCEKTSVQELADKLHIKHIFCDPSPEERKKLGILSEESKDKRIELREKEWLNRMRNELDKKILFVCGEKHKESFQVLLKERGIISEIASEKHWGKVY